MGRPGWDREGKNEEWIEQKYSRTTYTVYTVYESYCLKLDTTVEDARMDEKTAAGFVWFQSTCINIIKDIFLFS